MFRKRLAILFITVVFSLVMAGCQSPEEHKNVSIEKDMAEKEESHENGTRENDEKGETEEREVAEGQEAVNEKPSFLPEDIQEVSDPAEAGLPDIKREGEMWVVYDIKGRQVEIPENLERLWELASPGHSREEELADLDEETYLFDFPTVFDPAIVNGMQLNGGLNDSSFKAYSSVDGTQPEHVEIMTLPNDSVMITCSYEGEGMYQHTAHYDETYRLTYVEERQEGYDEQTSFDEDTFRPVRKTYSASQEYDSDSQGENGISYGRHNEYQCTEETGMQWKEGNWNYYWMSWPDAQQQFVIYLIFNENGDLVGLRKSLDDTNYYFWAEHGYWYQEMVIPETYVKNGKTYSEFMNAMGCNTVEGIWFGDVTGDGKEEVLLCVNTPIYGSEGYSMEIYTQKGEMIYQRTASSVHMGFQSMYLLPSGRHYDILIYDLGGWMGSLDYLLQVIELEKDGTQKVKMERTLNTDSEELTAEEEKQKEEFEALGEKMTGESICVMKYGAERPELEGTSERMDSVSRAEMLMRVLEEREKQENAAGLYSDQ